MKILNAVLNHLKQPSTICGLVILATLAGLISQADADKWLYGFMLLVGAVEVVRPEIGKTNTNDRKNLFPE